MKCNHLTPHEIKSPEDFRDAYIKLEMYRGGWFSGVGYCEGYYPSWLYNSFGEKFDNE